MQKIELNESPGRSPVGLGCLDSFLNGGLEHGVITELFGEGGSGKTNICMQFAIHTASQGRRVFYLDSEGFSIERFRQMSVARSDIYDNIALFRLNSLEDQELSLLKVHKLMEKVKSPGHS
ncbi:DNA repair and recombination protein RadB [mine drainage metagenome]|uniref:DNA repair and recombination protein RadB n=1 Tax=mine drainage metagenome TaxID=410659 RepID=T0Y7E8_9ZZZZ